VIIISFSYVCVHVESNVTLVLFEVGFVCFFDFVGLLGSKMEATLPVCKSVTSTPVSCCCCRHLVFVFYSLI
jgi:hypothetical protein